MPALPQRIIEAWENKEGPIILATVSTEGVPNAIYASCVEMFNNEKLVVADNFFNKTRSNILAGSKGALVFITKEGKSFQVKGTIEYHESGDMFDFMKSWLNPKLPGIAATVINVDEAYSGAEKLL